jgi:6-phospho-3-hexuloisomerase
MSTTTLQTILNEMRQVLDEVDASSLDAFATRILAAPRVFVTGEGRSGLMARAFAMRLMHLGLVVYVVGETTTPSLADGDLLVAVSGSGTTGGTVHVAQEARKSGSAVLAVTTNPASPLTDGTEHTLVIPAATKWRREGEGTSIQPLGSLFDQCCHVALDGICLLIAERKHISNETARQRHTNVE